MAATYWAYVTALEMAPGKNILGIFNANVAAIIKIRKAAVHAMHNSYNEFYQSNIELRRCSANNGGIDITVNKMDSSSAAVPADVYVRTAGAWTDMGIIKRKPYSLYYPVSSGTIWPLFGESHPVCAVLWDAGYKSQYQPLTLRQNEGFRMVHFGNVNMGELDAEIIFTIE